MSSTRPVRPPPPSASGAQSPEDSLSIQVDPSLLEAAIAAVERRTRKPEPAPVAAHAPAAPTVLEELSIEIEIDGQGELVVPPELRELLDPGPPEPPPELLATIEARDQQIRQLEEELRETRRRRDVAEQQLRDVRGSASQLYTDFERFRQRAKKEREDAERAGEERVLAQFLDTTDNLDRALQHAPAENPLHRGLKMVVSEAQGRLRRLGVERLTSLRGTRFDPELHEALHHIPTEDVPAGCILEEVSAGYRLRGRLLRPARVTVAAPLPFAEPEASPQAPPDASPSEPAEPAPPADLEN